MITEKWKLRSTKRFFFSVLLITKLVTGLYSNFSYAPNSSRAIAKISIFWLSCTFESSCLEDICHKTTNLKITCLKTKNQRDNWLNPIHLVKIFIFKNLLQIWGKIFKNYILSVALFSWLCGWSFLTLWIHWATQYLH